jgi:hypothetical protein
MILLWIILAALLIVAGLFVFTQGGDSLGPFITMIGVVILIVLLVSPSRAVDNGHTHEGAVGNFYQTWNMPDRPTISCCSDQDCGPAASRLINGKWEAQEPEGAWIEIPEEKIENWRDSPDGRSHLCGRKLLTEFAVYCFVRGSGT